jgi:hypothetical protein
MKNREPSVHEALEKTLDVLGLDGKRLTLIQLDKRYGILNQNRDLSLAEIEAGLEEIFGYGSELIIRQLKRELAKIQ